MNNAVRPPPSLNSPLPYSPTPLVAYSEKYRDELRQREEQMRSLRESASLQEVESLKYAKEHENYEARILQLESDLSIAQQAHEQLDEQKHENMLLKETIDRMRFDMDEMRNAAVGGVPGYGVPGSAPGSVSKSLGAEMLGKMRWLGEEEGREEWCSLFLLVSFLLFFETLSLTF